MTRSVLRARRDQITGRFRSTQFEKQEHQLCATAELVFEDGVRVYRVKR